MRHRQRITPRRIAALCALVTLVGVAAACVPPKEPPPPPGLAFPCSTAGGSPVSGNDPLRSGWYPDQPGLNPSAGGGCAFGEQWSKPVDGQVYATPVVDPGVGPNGVVLVATETNHVYGFDAVTGQELWHRSDLGPAWNPDDLDPGCTDIDPSIGITSTPAIDATTHTAYLASKTYASGPPGPGQWKTHAIDLATGAEKPNFPAVIQGSAANDPTVSFDAQRHLQRPGLLLLNGVVYAAFGSHCAIANYRGWVAGVNASTGAITTLWTNEALQPLNPNPKGGIWQSGGRLIADQGQILLVSGNGVVSPVALPGATPPPTLAQAVIRLDVQPNGSLLPVDFFTPCNADPLTASNSDLGSGAPLVLPSNVFGSSPNLLVVVGKEGTAYLLDRDDLGGYQQGPASSCPEGSSNGDDAVSRFKLPNTPGPWATPAVWPGEGGSFFVTHPTFAGFGLTGKLTAYRVADSGGQPTLSLAGQSGDSFGFGSSSAIITSSGTTDGSALVWVVYFPVDPGGGVNAELRAYDTNPAGGVLTLRGSWPIGTGNKFTTPTVHDGRVYLGSRDGSANGVVRAFGVTGAGATQAPARGPSTARVPPDALPDREE